MTHPSGIPSSATEERFSASGKMVYQEVKETTQVGPNTEINHNIFDASTKTSTKTLRVENGGNVVADETRTSHHPNRDPIDSRMTDFSIQNPSNGETIFAATCNTNGNITSFTINNFDPSLGISLPPTNNILDAI